MKIEGLDTLKRKLAAMPREAKTEIRAALEKSADEMVATAKALAPVKHGDLRDSIIKGPGAHDLAVLVKAGGGAAGLAHIVEYGHGNAAPRPFFWPAFRSVRKRIRSRVSRATNKAARKVARGA